MLNNYEVQKGSSILKQNKGNYKRAERAKLQAKKWTNVTDFYSFMK